MVVVAAGAKVVGGDCGHSTSSSPSCWGSSSIMGISLRNPPILFAFVEDSPSVAFYVYILCLGWRSSASFLFL